MQHSGTRGRGTEGQVGAVQGSSTGGLPQAGSRSSPAQSKQESWWLQRQVLVAMLDTQLAPEGCSRSREVLIPCAEELSQVEHVPGPL